MMSEIVFICLEKMISFSKTVIYCSRWNSWIDGFLVSSWKPKHRSLYFFKKRGGNLSHTFTDFITLNKCTEAFCPISEIN